MAKIATVVGAAETWGYKIRGLTRRPESDTATALGKQGVDVVMADVNDYDSLVSAFPGSHFIFGATPTLGYYVWSNLPGAFVKSGGKMKVPHYDSKDILPFFRPTLLETAGKYVLVGNFDPSKINYPTIGDIRKNLVPFIRAILDSPEMKKGAMLVASIGTFNVLDMLQKLAHSCSKEFEFIETSRSLMMQYMQALGDQVWTDATDPMVLPDELGVDSGSIISLDDSLDGLEI
ncbi:hypothetical protein J3F84DRAFT_398824 [Trichoderma pleuroticola]